MGDGERASDAASTRAPVASSSGSRPAPSSTSARSTSCGVPAATLADAPEVNWRVVEALRRCHREASSDAAGYHADVVDADVVPVHDDRERQPRQLADADEFASHPARFETRGPPTGSARAARRRTADPAARASILRRESVPESAFARYRQCIDRQPCGERDGAGRR